MRGVYKANFQSASLSAGPKTQIQITAPSTMCVEILSATITNTNNATNQQLESFFQRASVAGTGSTAVTAAKAESGDQAAQSTVGSAPTGEPTYTANTKLGLMGWASLSGYQFFPVPEERPVIPPSGILGLVINTASFSATVFDVEVTFREIG